MGLQMGFQMGFQKLQNKLAATANYYGAGRPVSKLTGACGARIKFDEAEATEIKDSMFWQTKEHRA